VEKELLKYMEERLGVDKAKQGENGVTKGRKKKGKDAGMNHFVTKDNEVGMARRNANSGELVETFESVVAYEAWMDGNGKVKGGINFEIGTDVGDRMDRLHPEIWLGDIVPGQVNLKVSMEAPAELATAQQQQATAQQTTTQQTTTQQATTQQTSAPMDVDTAFLDGLDGTI